MVALAATLAASSKPAHALAASSNRRRSSILLMLRPMARGTSARLAAILVGLPGIEPGTDGLRAPGLPAHHGALVVQLRLIRAAIGSPRAALPRGTSAVP